MDNLPSRLQGMREDAGLSQNALARILGLAVSTISRLESGELNNPTLDTIDRVCAFFGVNRSWLIDGKSPRFAEETPQAAWARYDQVLAETLGTEEQREKRQEKLLAEIAVRLTQLPHNDEASWKLFRRQIIEAMDAHAAFCLKHSAEIRQARLKIGRAAARKNTGR